MEDKQFQVHEQQTRLMPVLCFAGQEKKVTEFMFSS